jgi:Flp pilus assembly protein TadD
MSAEKYRAHCSDLFRNPDDANALVDQYAVISENTAQAKHHLPIARRAYELNPNRVAAAFNYGTALHRVGRFKEGVDLYQRALAINDPEWMGRIYHHLGIGCRATGRQPQGRRILPEGL